MFLFSPISFSRWPVLSKWNQQITRIVEVRDKSQFSFSSMSTDPNGDESLGREEKVALWEISVWLAQSRNNCFNPLTTRMKACTNWKRKDDEGSLGVWQASKQALLGPLASAQCSPSSSSYPAAWLPSLSGYRWWGCWINRVYQDSVTLSKNQISSETLTQLSRPQVIVLYTDQGCFINFSCEDEWCIDL